MEDYLMFRKMITPIIIQAVFWVLSGLIVLVAVLGGLMALLNGHFGTAFGALVMAVLGPIGVRIYCELTILFFRINENLMDIRQNTQYRP